MAKTMLKTIFILQFPLGKTVPHLYIVFNFLQVERYPETSCDESEE